MLVIPCMERTFHVHTNASKEAFGSDLTQNDSVGKLRAVQFVNRSLGKDEKFTAILSEKPGL